MSAVGQDDRESLFSVYAGWMSEIAVKVVGQFEKDPTKIAVVLLDNEDEHFGHLKDELVPQDQWEVIQDADDGAICVECGVVDWSTIEFICTVCPDVSGLLERQTTVGHIYALVLAKGGVSVYEVPYTGGDA